MAEKQAECDFKDEQLKGIIVRAEKAEFEALAMQNRMADCESGSNHLRRIMQSVADEKSNLEAKLENITKEKERQNGQT